jgi:DNA-binding response OmpR family regulator
LGLLSSAATARVVLVDDDDYVREVTEMILAGAGHSVRATANGFEALRWLEEEPCDLLMLDLRMPEIDGLTLYREVFARWPKGGPRVLFVSGFSEASCHAEALKTMDAPVLMKPFTLDELTGAIERVLAMP